MMPLSLVSSSSVALLLSLAVLDVHVEAFSLIPSSSSSSHYQRHGSISVLHTTQQQARSTCLYNAVQDDNGDEEDDDDDDEYIDTDALGDWRNFRRTLALDPDAEKSSQAKEKNKKRKSVCKENEELLLSQNEPLAKEYMSGLWAHETSTPEVGGLVLRLPLEAEVFRNHRTSLIGRELQKLLDDGAVDEVGIWYARAKTLIEGEMKKIASMADDQGQIDATSLKEMSTEMLGLFLDNQESWQEVCLVLEKDETTSTSKTLVLNRPMAFKLTENLGKLVLNGAFSDSKKSDREFGDGKDTMRFMMAFSSECAVYVGGPDNQGSAATMVHGISNLKGAIEISPGSKIYRGGMEAAVQGVLEGKYNPMEFRFFVGCHEYKESALDLAVHLGKYQPVACARSLALKQCISLPKPLWHEVMEVIGGDLMDLSNLELMKRDDIQFSVVDETEYDDEEIVDELGELENLDDEDEEYYL